MKITHRIPLSLVLCLGLAGCYGTADEAAGGATLGLSDVAPLPLVPREAWTAAVAGCEDRLQGVGSFGVAEGEPALVVALSIEGHSVCVDALEAVDLELREQGEDPAADDLCARYLVVIDGTDGTRRETSSVAPRAADPSPQPNLVGTSLMVDKGDPSPQPNLEGTTSTDDGKATSTGDTGGTSGTTTSTTTTTPRTAPGPEEGDPSPQPNSQAMQAEAPAPAPSSGE